MATIDQLRIKRQVLLFEIDRRCFFTDCNHRVFIGLTKPEAMEYRGFECSACLRWNEDNLVRKDVPEWWEEILASQDQAVH